MLACGTCNRHKQERWAEVRTDEAVEVSEGEEQAGAVPAMLLPRDEDPMAVLELDLELGVFSERSGVDAVQRARVEWTLGLLKLNERAALLKQRRTAFGDLKRLLREYVYHREPGHDYAAEVRARPHQTVWEEMKRQRRHHAEVDALFALAPEALGW